MGPKKRVLIAHPILGSTGGDNGVAAWAIEALRESCELSLATLRPVDCAGLNRTFGTSLRESDFRLHLPPARYETLQRIVPTRGALFDGSVSAGYRNVSGYSVGGADARVRRAGAHPRT